MKNELKEVWLIYSVDWYGEDYESHGYFNTEEEAKRYCKWKNELNGFDPYRYVNLNDLSKKKEYSYFELWVDHEFQFQRSLKVYDEKSVKETCKFYHDPDGFFRIEFTVNADFEEEAVQKAKHLLQKIMSFNDVVTGVQSIGGEVIKLELG